MEEHLIIISTVILDISGLFGNCQMMWGRSKTIDLSNHYQTCNQVRVLNTIYIFGPVIYQVGLFLSTTYVSTRESNRSIFTGVCHSVLGEGRGEGTLSRSWEEGGATGKQRRRGSLCVSSCLEGRVRGKALCRGQGGRRRNGQPMLTLPLVRFGLSRGRKARAVLSTHLYQTPSPTWLDLVQHDKDQGPWSAYLVMLMQGLSCLFIILPEKFTRLQVVYMTVSGGTNAYIK